MQAIVTRYVGPTDWNGARIVARCDGGRIRVSWDHALNPPGNHAAAAQALAEKLEWRGQWVTGCLPDGRYVHVPLHGKRFTVKKATTKAAKAKGAKGGAR
jgi:hypothetical protein